MKPFYNRILICLLPCIIAAAIVGTAVYRYVYSGGGFKLGVDLVGGTILVYEIDPDKKPRDFKPEVLVATLKRRIDPNDLKNVIIRPVSDSRVEIVLPTGGAHQAKIDDDRWRELLAKVKNTFHTTDHINDVPRDQPANLTFVIKQDLDQAAWDQLIAAATAKWPKVKDELEAAKPPLKVDDTVRFRDVLKAAGAKDDEAAAFIAENYTAKLTPQAKIEEFIAANSKSDSQRKDVSAEGVEEIKKLVSQAGTLEFRIVANAHDDKEGIEAARNWIEGGGEGAAAADRADRQRQLRQRAERGLPPPSPNVDGKLFSWSNGETGSAESHGEATYSWVELGKQERIALGLNNDAAGSPRWQEAAAARAANKTFTTSSDAGDFLLYSRESVSNRLTPEERKAKQFEYFVLVRDPGPNLRITGEDLPPGNVTVGQDRELRPSIDFAFNQHGSNLFGDVTEANRPTGNPPFYRHLAILLDDQIISAPRLLQAIHGRGQITGSYKQDEASEIVKLLRSGALPATLKPVPVSENTIGPTLGADTISSGTWSVGIAFVAILAFMLIYYHFAGVVACIALLANLLLTIAFMVLVGATFTLPGLAGLVLMLGMAVDANVLIYERIREERDRGLNMVQAIRNGYDRAFPTIIDTHLSSIFTAVVLWAIGTDQLKGFGISLTFGLIISLFTSLYMTRLIFDLALAKNIKWATNLTMFRLLTKTNIDFMAIRYYWFTATIIITVLGMGLFLARGKQGLNIDFNGGTAYTGQLEKDKPKNITYLRDLLSDAHQKARLEIKEVQQGDTDRRYTIVYMDGSKQTVELADPPAGSGAPKEQQEQALKARASILPDWSVEQIFRGDDNPLTGESRMFTVRTSEKAPELVQLAIDRLFTDKDNNSLLTKIVLEKYPVSNGGKNAELYFSDYASPSNVKTLLEREARTLGVPDTVGFELVGSAGEGKDLRYKHMKLDVSGGEAGVVDEAKLTKILKATADGYAARPQPERLENFDSQLATETQRRALYAILASWGAILLYLWFRFGTWTFGLAAVFCLIHDLFFTLGGLALCHYIHHSMPGLATLLGLHDFKIDLPSVAALLTLVGYSVNDTIVVFDRIREVRGKSPELTPKMINDSVNQTLSRTLLTAFSVWLVVIVLYIFGGEGIHLFAFVMVIGVIVGTYSSIYIASPLLLIFGEGRPKTRVIPKDSRSEVQSATV